MASILFSRPDATAHRLEQYSMLELEHIKYNINTLRAQILDLQNARSPLLRLPGEVRDIIFTYAMYAELRDRKDHRRYVQMFREPTFFSACRQIRAECIGVWYSDVVIWEEFDAVKGLWTRLNRDEIRRILCLRFPNNVRDLVVQPVHCTLERTRAAVTGSRTTCPRIGVVRVNCRMALPQLKWWLRP